jgi:signal transduction histidine kinase/CheY-like chemotaxis protein
MNSVLSVEEVLKAITEQAQAIVGAHQAVTSLVENQDWTKAVHATYLSDKYAAWRDYSADPDGSGIYARVCDLNRPMRLTQAELEAHPQWHGFGKEAGNHPPMRGWLAAPLMGRNGQNIGLIQLSDKYEGEFTESDEDILVQLAQMASVAIENTRLYEAEQNARAIAESANRIKDEFLAVLSHELRSPLNPILGWSRLMRNRKLNDSTTAIALETIERNAKLQTQLIEDLLDVSRILQGKMSLNTSPVNLAATVDAAVETVRLAAEAKRLDLKHEVLDTSLQETDDTSELSKTDEQSGKLISTDSNSKIMILGDPDRLQQVVWNLVSNAVKFTPQGGRIEVKLEKVEGTSNNRKNQENGPSFPPSPSPLSSSYAQLTVSDTGKGIEPEFLPFIFDYFRQEDGAINRRFGGLGLGLAIVRHIIELHGGTIYATSPGEGKGATFVVRLPLLQGNEEAADTENQDSSLTQQISSSTLEGLRILVVDDEADSRDLITFVLKQSGARVTAVESAIDALQALSLSEFDVLLSDVGMPEIDGYMLVRQIRYFYSDEKRHIPAIALTAYAGEFNQQQAVNAGFQTHLVKPVDPTELVTTITNLVN